VFVSLYVCVCVCVLVGQINLTVRIRSMQLPADPQLKSLSALLGTEWISLEDIQMKMSSLKRSQRSSTVEHHDISPVLEEPTFPVDDDHGCCWRCCCCCCHGCGHRRRRAGRRVEKYVVGNTNSGSGPRVDSVAVGEQKSMVITCQPGKLKSTSVECMVTAGDGGMDSDIGSLRRAADAVHSRCAAIYAAVAEVGNSVRTAVERYFEQDRGVLVLRVELLGGSGGVAVCCICTRQEHVAQFHDDRADKLATDLERVMLTAAGAQVRLDVTLDDGDLELAELELRGA